jgi:hypothetical protein
MNFHAKRAQLFLNHARRANFFKGGFGMGMNIMAPFHHIVVKIRNSVDDRHVALQLSVPYDHRRS